MNAMGLTVLSEPGRGAKQDGVDILAVGFPVAGQGCHRLHARGQHLPDVEKPRQGKRTHHEGLHRSTMLNAQPL